MKRFFSTVNILVITLFSALLLILPAFADDWALPDPFYVISEDGNRIFFVTPSYANPTDYPYATGLYYNTNPPELIFLVENPGCPLWEQDFVFSRDMKHFVWIPTVNGSHYLTSETLALVFYAKGEVQKIYTVSDFVNDSDSLIFTVSTTQWINANAQRGRFVSFTGDNQLTIETIEEVTFVFDLLTGEIIERSGAIDDIEINESIENDNIFEPSFRFEPLVLLAGVVIVALVLIGIIVFFIRKRRS